VSTPSVPKSSSEEGGGFFFGTHFFQKKKKNKNESNNNKKKKNLLDLFVPRKNWLSVFSHPKEEETEAEKLEEPTIAFVLF
jgi:hypothetical protein